MRLLFLLGFLLWTVPLSAGMYKWVDEKGVTHYSETPPPGRKGQQIQTPPASPTPAESPSTWEEKELDFRRRSIEREQAEEARKKKEAAERYQTAMRKELCMEAQGDLQALNAGRPIYWINEKGEREYLADSARPAAVERAKKRVETYCGPR